MKYLLFLLLIPCLGNKKINRKYEDCTFLAGVYEMSTGEKWKLRATKHSPEDYFVFECIERNCDNDIDQITFRYKDCDNDDDNGIVVLCPEDKSKNTDLTFMNCTSNICDKYGEEHFAKVAFHRRGKPTWTGKYSCSDN